MRYILPFCFSLLAVLNSSAQTWSLLGNGTNDYVRSICEFQNSLYVGGNFTESGGQDAFHIARWDGYNWYPVGEGIDVDHSSADISAMIVFNGELYVAGNFSFSDTINNIAKWNGTEWSPVGGGIEGIRVYDLQEYHGDLYAVGEFESAEGNDTKGIAKL